MFVRGKIWAGLFENLAAGWLALVLISPTENFLLFNAVVNGIISLAIAECIYRLTEKHDFTRNL